MRLKKILVFFVTIILAISLVGCGNQNTETAVANNLSKSADKLSSIVNNLEKIENEDIIIDGLSPIDETYTASRASQKYQIKNTSIKNSKYDFGKHILNALEINSQPTSKPKYNGNAKYVNGEKIGLDTINNSDEIKEKSQQKDYVCKDGVCYEKDCKNGECQELSNSKQITTNMRNQNSKNQLNKQDVENQIVRSNQTKNLNDHNSTVKNNDTNKYHLSTTTNYNKNNEYKSTYKPRYINEVSENFNRSKLDKYLNNIENVYNSCADCISCNEQCKIEQAKLEQNLKDCKVYCEKLKDGTITLSQEEILECNRCLKCLSNSMERLKSTKGNVSVRSEEILKNKDSFGGNVLTLKENYEKLFNTLESRLEYINDCNNNLNCIFDIINKTNVNVKEAEKNKSNESEIRKSEEIIKEDELYNNEDNIENKVYEDLNYPVDNNESNTNVETNNLNKKQINNYSNISNKIKRNTIKNSDNQNKTIKTKNTKNMGTAMDPSASETLTQKNKPQNNIVYREEYKEQPKKFEHKNLNNNSEQLNENKNENINTKNDSKIEKNIDTYKNNNAENSQKQEENKNIQSNNANINNLQPQPTINNPINNNYGYNYPYGYNGPILPYGSNGMPYPPRNIDTYRYINKNIDTYKPNYNPSPIQNSILNNQNDVDNNETKEISNEEKTDTIAEDNTTETQIKGDKNN